MARPSGSLVVQLLDVEGRRALSFLANNRWRRGALQCGRARKEENKYAVNLFSS